MCLHLKQVRVRPEGWHASYKETDSATKYTKNNNKRDEVCGFMGTSWVR